MGHEASQWEEVAPHLVVESCGICNIIGSGHLEEESRGALSRWLKGESDTQFAKKTMCSVLEPQEANGNIPLAEQLKFFEESSGEPVTSLASPPSMCTCVCVCVRVCVLTECTVLVTIKFPLDACMYARFRSNGTPVPVSTVLPYPYLSNARLHSRRTPVPVDIVSTHVAKVRLFS